MIRSFLWKDRIIPFIFVYLLKYEIGGSYEKEHADFTCRATMSFFYGL